MDNRRVIGYADQADSVTGLIRGYICIWGSPSHRDSYGTFFDRANPPDMALDFLPRPICYEHGDDGFVRKEIVGSVTSIFFDEVGIGFEGFLYRSGDFFKKLVDEILRGILKTSSSTAEHTALFDDTGRFVRWYLHELSLTKYPSEDLMPAVEILRSALDLGSRERRDASSPRVSEPIKLTIRRATTMRTLQEILAAMAAGEEVSLEELMAALAAEYGADQVEAAMQQASQTPPDAPPPTELSEAGTPATPAPSQPPATGATPVSQLPVQGQNALAQALQILASTRSTQQRSQQGEAPAGGHNPVPTRSAPVKPTVVSVGDKFQHLSAADMALGYILLESMSPLPKAMRAQYPPVSEEYMKAMAYKTAQAIKAGDTAANDYAVRSKFPFKNPDEVFQSNNIRAGEVFSGAAGQGAEWIYDLQGTQLWESVRNETLVYKTMLAKGMNEAEIPQGYDSELIPLEGSDPTFYVAPGASDIDASSGMPTPTFNSSKFGTGQKAVTVAKLSAAMDFRREVEEDSMINIVQEANRKIRVRATELMDEILINGDTELGANLNINLIDGTPAAAPAQPAYTLLNGLLKLPLVTNTANRRDCSTTFDEVDFLETLKLLPSAYRQNRDKLLFVVDSDTAIAASNITTLKTRDVFSAATLEEGFLTSIWRVDVLETGFMALANTAGKISATPANNLYGRLLLVRPDQWASRWKRRLQITVDYHAYPDVTQVVAHLRWGLAYRDTEASAVTYNIPEALT